MATEGLQRVEPPRSTNAGAGVDWSGQGWRLFAKAPLMWVVSILVIFVIAIMVNIVPFIGQVAFQLMQPVFAAGFVVACRALETGSEFEIEHLFAGFKRNLSSLLIVGIILLAGLAVLFVVFALFAGFGVVMSLMTGSASDMVTAGIGSVISILIGLLVMLLLMVPLLMFYWFAPALVIMHDMAPVAAMKESFRGCLRNIVPFLIYGIVMTLLSILAAIPFGLGMLVWVPVAIASTYAAYRSIYTEETAPAEPAMARAA